MYQLVAIPRGAFDELEGLYADADTVVLAVKTFFGSSGESLTLRYDKDANDIPALFLSCVGIDLVAYDLDAVSESNGKRTNTGVKSFSLELGHRKFLCRNAYYVIGYYDSDGLFHNDTYFVLDICNALYEDSYAVFTREIAKVTLAGYAAWDCVNSFWEADDAYSAVEKIQHSVAVQMAVLETGVYVNEKGKEYCIRPVMISSDHELDEDRTPEDIAEIVGDEDYIFNDYGVDESNIFDTMESYREVIGEKPRRDVKSDKEVEIEFEERRMGYGNSEE